MNKKIYGVQTAISWTLLLFILQLPEVNQSNDYFYLIATLTACCFTYSFFYSFSEFEIDQVKKEQKLWINLQTIVERIVDVALFLSFISLVMIRTDYPTPFGFLWLVAPPIALISILAFAVHRIYYREKSEISAHLENITRKLESICKRKPSSPDLKEEIKTIYEEFNLESQILEEYLAKSNDTPNKLMSTNCPQSTAATDSKL
ncbi:hypothetical protein CXF86_11105 [Shewanella sp. GutCb]|uniref:hypothetical protein n=1 Tax=Shewanella sp. GutCb TaxID=2058315 RepID=UPI000C7D00DE|nr:hypothetical protein [Shewanella sp. GutCb]PKG74830.1 hypothetical protein CXF86_11105 [Shewanella sp. GutCb]